ncbi:MAG: neutral/alkaline non-lysosomal ceramidase N-terminal domain-containing protein [Bryobacteraceae bacterium]
MLLAGTGRSDITPAPGTPQGGWGAQLHQRGIAADMPFFATALALADGATQAAIVDVDAIGFDAAFTDRILQEIEKLSGLSRSHIRLSCTHTHSGPNTFRLPMIREGLDMVQAYLDQLPGRIAGAVWQAQQNMRPVRVGAAAGACAINANRRVQLTDGRMGVGVNDEGLVDRTVRVVRFDDEQGKPVAALLHYACHPTTIAWQSHYFTPDYPGAARQVMERELDAHCLFLQGAAGNLGPRVGFTGDLSVYRKAGHILGLEGARLALEIETRPTRRTVRGFQESGAPIALYDYERLADGECPLRIAYEMTPLPVRPFPSPADAEAEAEKLRAKSTRIRTTGTESEIRAATALATQAGTQADLARLFHGKTHPGWPLQTICLGPIALTAVAGEPFAETGIEITAGSPFAHTLFSGYSNGGFGYIPTRQAFHEGGYETTVAPFSEDAAEVLRDAALHQLRSVGASRL